MRPDKDKNERRSGDRFPIEREVRYKILDGKNVDEICFGHTINVSSSGVLFSTDQHCISGGRLELLISWPAQLDSKVALQLVVRGRIVRWHEEQVAMEICQHEFRTQAPSGQ